MEEPPITPHRPPVERRSIAWLVVIGLLSTAGGIALGLIIDWFPPEASSQADKIDTLYNVLIICVVPIFVLVETVVLYSAFKFRMRPGEEQLDGPPIHGNTRLEILWTAGPAALIASLVVYAAIVLHNIEKKPAGREIAIGVTGQQFAWSFEYPEKTPGGQHIVADQLWLQVGQPVKFLIHSADVIHAFWVPAFRIQEDAVPGVTTSYRITPTRLGTYDVICNELCGYGHSLMRSYVHVVTPSAYRAWLARYGATQTLAADPTPRQVAAMGKTVFTGAGSCGSCHTLAAAGTQSQIGPNLDRYLRGHSLAFIRRAIVDPNADTTKGFGANIMPGNYSTSLSKDQIGALVTYLAEVTAK
jgi:cytochrome c oxidase subunit 2